MATYSYYFRLTSVHAKDVNKLDPKLGRIIAETATTGKFIIGDIVWDSGVSPNKDTAIAMATQGEMKIYEPLGVRFLDYLRFAALELGLQNHLDARYLLEMEIVSETLPDNQQFRYVWPIMILSTDAQVTEKGAEYNCKFVHCGHHTQTDMVQPIKEPLRIDGVSKVDEYFKELGRKLELMEFKYAEAGQKAGKAGAPGGDHPAEQDPYHDEYHFIIDPRIEKFTLSNKGAADDAVQGSWGGLGSLWGSFNVTAKTGTTLTSQIQRVLSSTKEAADLYLLEYGNMPGAGKSGSQSSDANKKKLKEALGKIYNFFRVETHTVYKEYDYIRGRYAVKHVFIIWAALQPNLYQYPDELDELNKPENRGKVEQKLKAYIQEGLLRKAYYFQYTGLNTEILKLNVQLNQAYYLPSFPMVWTDRGTAGPGPMNPYNFSRVISPYGRTAEDANTRNAIIKEQEQARQLSQQIQQEKSSSKRKELQKQLDQKKAAIAQLQAQTSINPSSVNTGTPITNRGEYLDSLKNLYIEDLDYQTSLSVASRYSPPAHRPRMEPSEPVSKLDEKKSENDGLMDKVFTVQLGARDLMELELTVRADPYWLGQPNMMLAGKKYIEKLDLPPALLERINQVVPKIDPEFNSRDVQWGNYDDQAKFYKGGILFYFNSQLPVNDFGTDDTMKFDQVDQLIGIYMVVTCRNEFKNGQWTQVLNAKRDLTIISNVIPRASIGDTVWEDYVKQAVSDPERAVNAFNEKKDNEVANRDSQAADQGLKQLRGEEGMGAAGRAPAATTTTNPRVQTAEGILERKLAASPPPQVEPPVPYAESLVRQGYSKQQAYTMAKSKFGNETKNYYGHLENLNKEAYSEAGVTDYKPYKAETLAGIVTQRSGNGGLEDWKANNTKRPGAWSLNNPGNLGFDPRTGRSNQYDSYSEGMKAVNNYYNYGKGVSANGRQGSDRFLLPADNAKSETDYISLKSKGRGI